MQVKLVPCVKEARSLGRRLYGIVPARIADADSIPGGAVYVDHLDLEGGIGQIADITGNGMRLYYRLGNPDNSYLGGKTYELAGGGSISPVPEPAGILLSSIVAPLLIARRRNSRVCFSTPRRRA